MSPPPHIREMDAESFPRVSGDEPLIEWREVRSVTFSPRERG